MRRAFCGVGATEPSAWRLPLGVRAFTDHLLPQQDLQVIILVLLGLLAIYLPMVKKSLNKSSTARPSL